MHLLRVLALHVNSKQVVSSKGTFLCKVYYFCAMLLYFLFTFLKNIFILACKASDKFAQQGQCSDMFNQILLLHFKFGCKCLLLCLFLHQNNVRVCTHTHTHYHKKIIITNIFYPRVYWCSYIMASIFVVCLFYNCVWSMDFFVFAGNRNR